MASAEITCAGYRKLKGKKGSERAEQAKRDHRAEKKRDCFAQHMPPMQHKLAVRKDFGKVHGQTHPPLPRWIPLIARRQGPKGQWAMDRSDGSGDLEPSSSILYRSGGEKKKTATSLFARGDAEGGA